jgi:hypothetical protein
MKEILTTTSERPPLRVKKGYTAASHHPEYDFMLPYWVFYLNSYEGGPNYTLNSDYLFTHSRETSEDRSFRLRRVVYYNYCRSVVDVYVSHLYKKEIIRESKEPGYAEFLHNIDLRGDSVDAFMSQFVAPMALVFGTVYVLVDMPAVSDEIVSSYEESLRSIRPYANVIMPLDLVDWDTDRFGRFNWVKIREVVPQDPSPLTSRGLQPAGNRYQYRIWTKEAWYLIDEDENFINRNGARGEPHPVGAVPVVAVTNERSFTRELAGVSAIADIAPCCQKIYNLSSLLDEFLYKQCFSFLAWPGEIDTEELGTSNVATYDPESRLLPAYVTPPTDPAKFIESQIDKNIEEIYRLARLKYEGTHPKVAQSGFAKAIEFHDTDNILAKKARNLEQAEREIAELYFRWIGQKSDARIVYPREFNVRAVNDEIEEAIRVMSLNLSPRLNAKIATRLARRILPNIQEGEAREIISEIEKGAQKV